MTTTTKPTLLTSLLHIFFTLICILPNALNSHEIENENANVKGMFVFGSSLVDNGNNNNLQNLAKADYLPYGVDFPLGPSGRFTNGKNVIDLLGEKLGLPSFIPTFTDPSTKGNRTLGGVNYASGGSGILDDTGSIIGDIMTLNEQIKKFEEVTLPDLDVQLEGNSKEAIPKYLFVVGSGGNDYTLNFFLTNAAANISVEAFTANLTTTLSGQLKKLYNLGARKFIIMSLYPLGCSPSSVAANPQQNGCTPFLNRAARLFNFNLKLLVDAIKPRMPGSRLVVVNAFKIVSDIIECSPSNGFSNTTNACCEVGGNGISCKRGGSVCANRSGYVYFDGLHPTEAVNEVLATKAFASDSEDEVYPINVRQLARLSQ